METTSRTVRKDVLRNRALLLESADAVIREHGMDLSLNAVAHHAGVGVGTVYRHFPDREALIKAMFEQRVDRVYEIMSSHVKDEDPVEGLRAAVFEICQMQATDRGVWEVASAGGGESNREIVQTRLLPTARKLVRRANATGRLRVKFEANDLPVLLWTGGALHAYLGACHPRLVALRPTPVRQLPGRRRSGPHADRAQGAERRSDRRRDARLATDLVDE